MPSFYGWPIGVRFELSGEQAEHEEAIERAHTRAEAIFQTTFAQTDEVWVLASKPYHLVPTFWRRWVREPSSVLALRRLGSAFAPDDWAHRHEARVSSVTDDYRSTWSELSVRTSPDRVDHSRLLHVTAGYERGLGDRDWWDTHFVDPARGIVFYMYDDRGLDVMATSPDAIRHVLEAHADWVLEYDRDRIEATFGKF